MPYTGRSIRIGRPRGALKDFLRSPPPGQPSVGGAPRARLTPAIAGSPLGADGPGSTNPRDQSPGMAHRAFGVYVHITWHTRLRQRSLLRGDADLVRATIREAAARCQVHVHEVAVLSDHVHVIASVRPEGGVVSFIRHAKSESARRINQVRGAVFQWARGYFVESLSRTHVRAACAYVARQHLRHPDLIPN
jgi:REP element-mobilizing transposase RayT